MTPDEKSLIEDLFNRLRSSMPGGRDAEAERAIEAEMARSPGAAYALVQTVLVQDHALHEAHDKMQAAEAAAQQAAARQAAAPQQPPPSFLERAGSALSGFGQRRDAPPPPPQGQAYQGGPYQGSQYQAPEPPQAAPQGGGFMRGALQTAAGVAGGALLFEGVRSMFGGGGGLLGGGMAGGNSLLGGSGLQGPWGNQAPETINETIINEAPRDDRNDDNVRDADYDPSDDYSDDTDFDSNDDGSSGSDDSWV